MADLNSWTMTGRLTRDPELRTTSNGKTVCNFRMASNGFREGDTTYVDVTVWERAGETAAQYLSKGSRVGVVGPGKSREYQKRDGDTGFSMEITAREVSFLETKAERENNGGGGGSAAPAARPAAQPAPAAPQTDDDIPF